MITLRLLPLCFLFTFAAYPADAFRAPMDGGFDSRIDTWVEGTVMGMEIKGAKFTLRGARRPYATLYARMLKEIHDRTAKMKPADREARSAQIRAAWSSTLERARAQNPGEAGDVTIRFPSQDAKVIAYDETDRYERPNEPESSPANPTAWVRPAAFGLSELRVGQNLVVGYSAGALQNEAFVLVKVASGTAERGVGAVPEFPATPDTPARQIRRALIADDSLSMTAQHIHIDVENGVARLKGTVLTEKEKATVELKAASVVGSSKIVSSLDVARK